MKSYEAILFDCDGVLLDSEPLGCEALARAITAAGIPMDRQEATRIFSGNSAQASLGWMQQAGLDPEATFLHADRILFAMFDEDVPLIPGIRAVLQAFDVPMAVCSNSNIDRLARSIAVTELAPRFDGHIYSAQHVAKGKPAPDLALFAAGKLGIDPGKAVFIDDNPQGLRCGVEAGCLPVGFIGPSEHREGHAGRLRDAGAVHVAHGMEELLDFLCTISLPLAA